MIVQCHLWCLQYQCQELSVVASTVKIVVLEGTVPFLTELNPITYMFPMQTPCSFFYSSVYICSTDMPLYISQEVLVLLLVAHPRFRSLDTLEAYRQNSDVSSEGSSFLIHTQPCFLILLSSACQSFFRGIFIFNWFVSWSYLAPFIYSYIFCSTTVYWDERILCFYI